MCKNEIGLNGKMNTKLKNVPIQSCDGSKVQQKMEILF